MLAVNNIMHSSDTSYNDDSSFDDVCIEKESREQERACHSTSYLCDRGMRGCVCVCV